MVFKKVKIGCVDILGNTNKFRNVRNTSGLFLLNQSTFLIMVHFHDTAFDDAHVPLPYHLIPVQKHTNAFKQLSI